MKQVGNWLIQWGRFEKVIREFKMKIDIFAKNKMNWRKKIDRNKNSDNKQ